MEGRGRGSVMASHWLSRRRLSLVEWLPGEGKARPLCRSSGVENSFPLEIERRLRGDGGAWSAGGRPLQARRIRTSVRLQLSSLHVVACLPAAALALRPAYPASSE